MLTPTRQPYRRSFQALAVRRAWSYVLALSTVANIAVNDYVIISGAANGTTPGKLQGVHKVTNVDVGNTRITVLSKFRNAAAAAGAVTANVLVLKTVITTAGVDCFTVVSGQCGWVKKMCLVGNGTGNGLTVGGNGLCGFSQIGVTGFTLGVFATGAATMWSDASVSASSGNTEGFQADYGATLYAPNAISTGNGDEGFQSLHRGFIAADSAYAGGNQDCGFWIGYGAPNAR